MSTTDGVEDERRTKKSREATSLSQRPSFYTTLSAVVMSKIKKKKKTPFLLMRHYWDTEIEVTALQNRASILHVEVVLNMLHFVLFFFNCFQFCLFAAEKKNMGDHWKQQECKAMQWKKRASSFFLFMQLPEQTDTIPPFNISRDQTEERNSTPTSFHQYAYAVPFVCLQHLPDIYPCLLVNCRHSAMYDNRREHARLCSFGRSEL